MSSCGGNSSVGLVIALYLASLLVLRLIEGETLSIGIVLDALAALVVS